MKNNMPKFRNAVSFAAMSFAFAGLVGLVLLQVALVVASVASGRLF